MQELLPQIDETTKNGTIHRQRRPNGLTKAELCVQALENACRGINTEGLILHSDRGSQFTSQLFRKALRRYKIVAEHERHRPLL